MSRDLAGVVLAAGLGTRLRPLTDLRPKALCPIGERTLLDRALDRLASVGLEGARAVAVNAHHHRDQVARAVRERATVSVEAARPLGSAGALAKLTRWRAGRPLLVTNADAYLAGPVSALLADWDGRTVRLLVVPAPGRADFGPWRFAGCSLLPHRVLTSLLPMPSDLATACWKPAIERGEAEFIPFVGTFIDCGTAADYLAANLHATGGESWVAADAVVEGDIERCVVWPGARVDRDEALRDAVRAPGVTVWTRAGHQ